MLLNIFAILAGLAVLVWGADRFISAAAALADNLGVSPIMIGLTIVGFGTSAPEVLVSSIAAIEGNPGLAIGNAIGSNIANIGLILGSTALVVPLTVRSEVLQREYPLLLAVSLISLALMWDGTLSRLDGAVLLVLLIGILGWMVYSAKMGASDPIAGEFDAEIPHGTPTSKAVWSLVVGLLALLLSSKALVWGAVNLATALGINEVVIGLTVVAIGTSLPELAATIASALKGEHDIAIGNVVGSNLYNILAVLSLPGLIAPGPFLPEIIHRDQPVMIGLTVALFLIGYGFRRHGRINRLEGLILVIAFAAYQSLLFFNMVES